MGEPIADTDWMGDDHAAVEQNFSVEPGEYARSTKAGKVHTGEAGIYVRPNPDSVRGADVLYISYER